MMFKAKTKFQKWIFLYTLFLSYNLIFRFYIKSTHIKIISLYKTEQEAFMVFDKNTPQIFFAGTSMVWGNSMIKDTKILAKK